MKQENKNRMFSILFLVIAIVCFITAILIIVNYVKLSRQQVNLFSNFILNLVNYVR